jgi:phage gp36-like protein
MFLSNEEMHTHLYDESVSAISQGDETIMTAAIDAALQETKSYLSAYDKDIIFSATGGERNGLLLVFVKDIAAWHFLVLCNAGVELKLRQDRYERAINWLKAVQKGDITPDLPLKETTGLGIIKYGSNIQRGQHF